jgi:hypothetical protein
MTRAINCDKKWLVIVSLAAACELIKPLFSPNDNPKHIPDCASGGGGGGLV